MHPFLVDDSLVGQVFVFLFKILSCTDLIYGWISSLVVSAEKTPNLTPKMVPDLFPLLVSWLRPQIFKFQIFKKQTLNNFYSVLFRVFDCAASRKGCSGFEARP